MDPRFRNCRFRHIDPYPTMRNFPGMTLKQFTREKEREFLMGLMVRLGSPREAALQAGVSVQTVYRRVPRAGKVLAALKAEGAAPVAESLEEPPSLPPTEQEIPGDDARVEWLLEFFGVVLEGKRKGRFWWHYAGRLDVLHFEARKGYMAMVRRLHPDSGAGDAERMARVNAAWGRLEGAFRRHGWVG